MLLISGLGAVTVCLSENMFHAVDLLNRPMVFQTGTSTIGSTLAAFSSTHKNVGATYLPNEYD